MKTYLPFCIVLVFLQFLFTAESIADPQTIKIGEESFSTILKDDYPPEELPSLTYSISSEDFIYSRGKGFKGDPPISNVQFEYSGEKWDNFGKLNNKILEALFLEDKSSLSNALKMVEEGILLNPIYFPFRYNAGRMYSLNGNKEQAILEFIQAARIFPEYYRTYLHLGRIHESLRQFRKAENFYRFALQKNPESGEVKYLLCSLSTLSREGVVFRNFKNIDSGSPEEKFYSSLCNAIIEKSKSQLKKSFTIINKIKPDKLDLFAGDYYLLNAELSLDAGKKEGSLENYRKLLSNKFHPIYLFFNRNSIERKIESLEK